MREQPIPIRVGTALVDGDCWNRIGVHGDRSCPELQRHVHCRNCPVYSAGAADRLDVDPPPGYVTQWTTHFARPAALVEGETRSVVIFRVAAEWLALPTSIVTEVINPLPVHSLPHRHGGAVLGLASVRGELLVCLSLGRMIGVEAPAATIRSSSPGYPRLLLIRREDVRAVCPVDEVFGIHRFSPRELAAVPTTVARATVTYSTALLSWHGQTVAMLDDQLLFHTMKRSLA